MTNIPQKRRSSMHHRLLQAACRQGCDSDISSSAATAGDGLPPLRHGGPSSRAWTAR